jgi:hypothetical protein
MAKSNTIIENIIQKDPINNNDRPTWMPMTAVNAERVPRGGPKKITPPNNAKAPTQNPILMPPSFESGIFEPQGDANNTWNSGKVEGLWVTEKSGNCWIFLREENWIKIAETTETGVEAMMLLASIARDSGANFLYRKGKEGMIQEVYLW